mgnify:CR=1 FL=1
MRMFAIAKVQRAAERISGEQDGFVSISALAKELGCSSYEIRRFVSNAIVLRSTLRFRRRITNSGSGGIASRYFKHGVAGIPSYDEVCAARNAIDLEEVRAAVLADRRNIRPSSLEKRTHKRSRANELVSQ